MVRGIAACTSAPGHGRHIFKGPDCAVLQLHVGAPGAARRRSRIEYKRASAATGARPMYNCVMQLSPAGQRTPMQLKVNEQSALCNDDLIRSVPDLLTGALGDACLAGGAAHARARLWCLPALLQELWPRRAVYCCAEQCTFEILGKGSGVWKHFVAVQYGTTRSSTVLRNWRKGALLRAYYIKAAHLKEADCVYVPAYLTQSRGDEQMRPCSKCTAG